MSNEKIIVKNAEFHLLIELNTISLGDSRAHDVLSVPWNTDNIAVALAYKRF